MSKRRMSINPAKLRAAIELAMEHRAVDASKMNMEEANLFRLIMSGVNDPFDGEDSAFRYETKMYLEAMRPFDETSS